MQTSEEEPIAEDEAQIQDPKLKHYPHKKIYQVDNIITAFLVVTTVFALAMTLEIAGNLHGNYPEAFYDS